MSKYTKAHTKIRDAKLLVEALKAMGFENVELHESPVPLKGYETTWNKRSAEVIIRRVDPNIYQSNDLGFAKQADGTFSAIIGEYDTAHGFNSSWLRDLTVEYAKRQVQQGAKTVMAQGYTPALVAKKMANGNLRYIYQQ